MLGYRNNIHRLARVQHYRHYRLEIIGWNISMIPTSEYTVLRIISMCLAFFSINTLISFCDQIFPVSTIVNLMHLVRRDAY